MQPAASEPYRVGTAWTLNPDGPLPTIRPLVEAAFTRLDPTWTFVLADAAGLTPEDIRQRFAGERRCYAALVREQVAAYGWVSFGEEYVGELDLHLTFRPEEAYIWDCATLPAFRRKKLYSALLVYIVGQLRAECPCQVWIGADVSNQPSQLGIDKAGFRRIIDLGVVQGVPSGRMRFVALPYPNVDAELVAEASRIFLGEPVSRKDSI